MKKIISLLLLFFIFSLCFSQVNPRRNPIIEDDPIKKLKFEDGKISFSLKCNYNRIYDGSPYVQVIARGINDTIFTIQNLNLNDKQPYIFSYAKLINKRSSLFNCILNENKIQRIYVIKEEDNVNERIVKYTADTACFNKFHEDAKQYVFDSLAKDPKFNHLIEEYKSKINEPVTELFDFYDQQLKSEYYKKNSSITKDYVEKLNAIIRQNDDYIRENLFSSNSGEIQLEKNQKAVFDTLESFSKLIRPYIPTYQYKDIISCIDKFKKDVNNYYNLCRQIATTKNSLTIDPLIRKLNFNNGRLENELQAEKLSLLSKIKANEFIVSCASGKISFETYQDSLKNLLNRIEKEIKNNSSSGFSLLESVLTPNNNYNSIIKNEKIDSLSKVYNNYDKDVLFLAFYNRMLQKDALLHLYYPNSKNFENELKSYFENLLAYKSTTGFKLLDFNKSIDRFDSLSYLSIDIILTLTKSDSTIMSTKEEIYSELEKFEKNRANINEQRFSIKSKSDMDSLLFIYMANVINPVDYNNRLNDIRLNIQNFKNQKPLVDYPIKKVLIEENPLSNLFTALNNEIIKLHSSIKNNNDLCREESEVRNSIYSENSRYLKIISIKGDSISNYVEFLIRNLHKLRKLNDCIDKNKKNTEQYYNCFENFYNPQNIILTGILSTKGFTESVDDFKTEITKYFQKSNPVDVNSPLNNQSKVFIHDLLKTHKYIFDEYYKTKMPQEFQCQYASNYFRNNPKELEKLIKEHPEFKDTIKVVVKNETDTHTKETKSKVPGNNNLINNETINIEDLAVNLSDKLAPKINYMNMKTYIGFGFYHLNSSKKEGWFQPINFEQETSLKETFEKDIYGIDYGRWECWQPFVSDRINIFSTKGISAEIGYGLKFIDPKKLNYLAIKPYVDITYLNIENVNIQDKEIADTFQINSFFEGEVGGCIEWKDKFNNELFTQLFNKHAYNLKLKVSHSLSDFNRTYNVKSLSGSNPPTIIDSYWGITLEPSIDIKLFRFRFGYKQYIIEKGSSDKYSILLNENRGSDNIKMNTFFRNRIYFQILINLNYFKHEH